MAKRTINLDTEDFEYASRRKNELKKVVVDRTPQEFLSGIPRSNYSTDSIKANYLLARIEARWGDKAIGEKHYESAVRQFYQMTQDKLSLQELIGELHFEPRYFTQFEKRAEKATKELEFYKNRLEQAAVALGISYPNEEALADIKTSIHPHEMHSIKRELFS